MFHNDPVVIEFRQKLPKREKIEVHIQKSVEKNSLEKDKRYATYKDISTRELNGRLDDENKIKKEPDSTKVKTT